MSTVGNKVQSTKNKTTLTINEHPPQRQPPLTLWSISQVTDYVNSTGEVDRIDSLCCECAIEIAPCVQGVFGAEIECRVKQEHIVRVGRVHNNEQLEHIIVVSLHLLQHAQDGIRGYRQYDALIASLSVSNNELYEQLFNK